jgi:hypothetical protein
MEQKHQTVTIQPHYPFPAGYISNGGTERYNLEAESTTGFVAWKLAEGEILVSGTTLVSIKPTPFISFWACAGYQDPSPAGNIVFFDCHGCGITRLDVRGLTGLEYLDASFNNLTEILLDGLTELQGLDVECNKLSFLEIGTLRSLRFLDCNSNRLSNMDVSVLKKLRIYENANNALKL